MHRDRLIQWLNDAHAMESALLPVLETRTLHLRDFPAAGGRFEEHVRETRRHVERVRQALEELGTSPGPLRCDAASLADVAQSVATGILSDQLVRNAITDYAAEQFEVAAYTAIIAAADEAGEPEVARLCRLNRGEDEDMAEWLDARISILVGEARPKLEPSTP